MIEPIKPITPSEVSAKQTQQIPQFVILIFNKLIAKNYNDGVSKVNQQDVLAEIRAARPNITVEEIFLRKMLNIESIFRAAGWQVTYDKPAYNETYDPFFIFEIPF